MVDREERIRRRAYEVWEREGRPHGRDPEHWAQAVQEVDAEIAAEAAEAQTEPAAEPGKRRRSRIATGAAEVGRDIGQIASKAADAGLTAAADIVEQALAPEPERPRRRKSAAEAEPAAKPARTGKKAVWSPENIQPEDNIKPENIKPARTRGKKAPAGESA